MPLFVLCGGCKKRLKVAETLLGKTIKCPGCAKKMVVPKPTSAAPVAAAKASGPVKKAVGNPVPAAPRTSVTAVKKAPAKLASKAPDKPAPKAPAPPVTKPAAAPPPMKPASAPRAPFKPTVALDEEAAKKRKQIIGLCALGLVLLGAFYWFFLRNTTLGYVSGTVTLDGLPVAQATLDFHPVELKISPPTDITDDEGNYTISGGKPIPVGKYKVTIRKIGKAKGTGGTGGEGEGESESGSTGPAKELDLLPAIYRDATDTPLNIEVVAGSKRYDFPLEGSKAGNKK